MKVEYDLEAIIGKMSAEECERAHEALVSRLSELAAVAQTPVPYNPSLPRFRYFGFQQHDVARQTIYLENFRIPENKNER